MAGPLFWLAQLTRARSGCGFALPRHRGAVHGVINRAANGFSSFGMQPGKRLRPRRGSKRHAIGASTGPMTKNSK